MKLQHLLVMAFGTSISSFLLVWTLARAGVDASPVTLMWLSVPVASFVALLVAWPISRLLRLSPLMIFAGPCPRCRTKPPGWWAAEQGRRRLVLRCGTCGEQVELWLSRKAPANPVPGTGHAFTLRWPE